MKPKNTVLQIESEKKIASRHRESTKFPCKFGFIVDGISMASFSFATCFRHLIMRKIITIAMKQRNSHHIFSHN